MTRHFCESLLRVTVVVCATSAGYASEGHAPRPGKCDAWMERTLMKVESKPVQQWRDVAIGAIARACDEVPVSLRTAAAEYGKARSDEARVRVLAQGAVAVLKANCTASVPGDFADALLKDCPLPIQEERRPSAKALGFMRAAEYVFLNAFVTSLVAAGAYDETAHRIVLDFVLSAANAGEARKKALSHRRAK